MKKTALLTAVLKLLFFIFFNVLFFVVSGVQHDSVVWFSYACVNFSYITFVLASVYVHKSASRYLFGLSAHGVSFFYFISACAAGVVCGFGAVVTFKFALALQIVLLFLYLFLFITVIIFNTRSSEAESLQRLNVNFKKANENIVCAAMDKASDPHIKKLLSEVYDHIKASPARSQLTTIGIENEIGAALRALASAAGNNESTAVRQNAEESIRMIDERIRILKMSN